MNKSHTRIPWFTSTGNWMSCPMIRDPGQRSHFGGHQPRLSSPPRFLGIANTPKVIFFPKQTKIVNIFDPQASLCHWCLESESMVVIADWLRYNHFYDVEIWRIWAHCWTIFLFNFVLQITSMVSGHFKDPPPHVFMGNKVATVLPMVGGRVLEGAVMLCHPTFTAI